MRFRSRTIRTPGAYRMYRTAPVNESKKPSSGASTPMLLPFQVTTAANTRTNATAFMANTVLTPTKGNEQTAERRTDDACQVHLNSSKCDCGRKLFFADDLRNRC